MVSVMVSWKGQWEVITADVGARNGELRRTAEKLG